MLCNRGFNPIDVLVEDALVDGGVDNGDTVEQFTDFIDSLLTQVDTPSDTLRVRTGGLDSPSKRMKHEPAHVGSPVSPLQLPASGHVPAESRSGNNGGGPSRKNKPQRCSICKEWGHKSRTCRLAPGREPPADAHSMFLADKVPNLPVLQTRRERACIN